MGQRTRGKQIVLDTSNFDGALSGTDTDVQTALETLDDKVGITKLSAITAADGANTIANGDNAQLWEWKLDTASRVGLEISDNSSASTGSGTALLKLKTNVSSTATPLTVHVGGTEIFNVGLGGNAALQVRAGAAGTPGLAFIGDPDNGVYLPTTNTVGHVAGGSEIFRIETGTGINASGTFQFAGGTFSNNPASKPGYTFQSGTTTGYFEAAADETGVSIGGAENSRWTSGTYRMSKGSADTVAYSVDVRKSRGSVASPSVITTGDVTMDLTGQPYVGATNAYIDSARIRFETEGTINDTGTGRGPGVIRFFTALNQDSGILTEALSIDSGQNVVIGTAALATSATDGFLYISTTAGVPIGTPTTKTGRVPVNWDSTNDDLYVYDGSWQTVGGGGAGLFPFGNAVDGSATISSNTTLTKDMYYDDLTVNTAITLDSNGYRIFVKGTLTLTGTAKIDNSGHIGDDGDSGGSGGDGGNSGVMSGDNAGGDGGTANGTGGDGSGSAVGGAGGDGGDSGGNTGGAGGAATAIGDSIGGVNIYSMPFNALFTLDTNNTNISPGSGGGGGAGDSSEQGGGGGGGGGYVWIFAKTIAGSGSIEAKGGDGAIAATTGNAAGGGGGGGGAIVLLSNSGKGSVTLSVAGGSGGAGNGTGEAGVAGSAGRTYEILNA